jgi:hypothetical protein
VPLVVGGKRKVTDLDDERTRAARGRRCHRLGQCHRLPRVLPRRACTGERRGRRAGVLAGARAVGGGGGGGGGAPAHVWRRRGGPVGDEGVMRAPRDGGGRLLGW